MIELLVVLAIFGILISLLQPTLKKMMNHSREMVCLNHLRQQNVALSAYTEEHDGFMPVAVTGSTGNPPWAHMYWSYELSGFTDNPCDQYSDFSALGTIFECPSNDFEGKGLTAIYGGYSHNYSFMGYYEGSTIPRQNIISADKPSESFIFGDSVQYSTDRSLKDPAYTSSRGRLTVFYRPTGWNGRIFEYRRHRGGTNLAWLDGHVSNMFWDDLAAGKNEDVLYYYRLVK